MKHIKEAQNLLNAGDSVGAMGILENLLSLAPRNPEALRLKAQILDAWGRFDESLTALHSLAQLNNLADEGIQDLERRAMEEKEAIVYSELTSEGRWYFAFPKAQIWISLYGFLGCAAFLLVSPAWLSQGPERFADVLIAFVFFVIFPWLGLMIVHFSGVKRVLVGLHGIRVCTRFAEKNYPWEMFGSAVVEYDRNIQSGHLRLMLFSKEKSSEPVLEFDISRYKSVVKARRHFAKSILSYFDVVYYKCRSVMKDSVAGEKHGTPGADSPYPGLSSQPQSAGVPDSPQATRQERGNAQVRSPEEERDGPPQGGHGAA